MHTYTHMYITRHVLYNSLRNILRSFIFHRAHTEFCILLKNYFANCDCSSRYHYRREFRSKRKNEDSHDGVSEYTLTEANGDFPLRATSRIKECSLPLASRNDLHLKTGISRAGDNDLSYDRVSIFVRGGQVRRLVFET